MKKTTLSNQENKQLEQQLVLDILKKTNFIGTWIAVTGCGKTKLGCMAADEIIKKYKEKSRILIIVPTENLKYNEWINELNKWGYENNLPYIDIQCIQTVYKWRNRDFDLVICDELHTQLTDLYSLFFIMNNFTSIIGLSATIGWSTPKWLNHSSS